MSDPHFPELPREVMLAVRSGRKLEAIKLLREHTGMDLTDAKRIVDRLAEESAPPRRQPQAGREDSGALRLAAAVLVLGAIAAAYYLL